MVKTTNQIDISWVIIFLGNNMEIMGQPVAFLRIDAVTFTWCSMKTVKHGLRSTYINGCVYIYIYQTGRCPENGIWQLWHINCFRGSHGFPILRQPQPQLHFLMGSLLTSRGVHRAPWRPVISGSQKNMLWIRHLKNYFGWSMAGNGSLVLRSHNLVLRRNGRDRLPNNLGLGSMNGVPPKKARNWWCLPSFRKH